MNARQNTALALAASAALTPLLLSPVASAAGLGVIAFERYTSQEPIENIAVVDAAGGPVTPLTDTQAVSDVTPDFSPDGSKIALARAGAATDGVWTMNTDGSGLASVGGTAFGTRPSWSPDGSKLAFTKGSGQQSELYLVDADGTDLTLLTRNRVADRAPAWSPDGGSLVFERSNAADSASAILVLDLTTGQTSPVTGYSHLDSAPDWSAKGQLVFSRYLGAGDSDLYTVQPDGTGLQALTSGPLQDNHPSWSPNGNAVAFSRGGADEADHAHIFRVHKNGQQLTQLTSGAVKDFFPTWGPA